MNHGRGRTLLLSALALCLCTMIIVGATYALFTDTVKVTHHLTAGSLEIGLYRTDYEYTVVDETTGLLTKVTEPDDVNLVENGAALFEIENAVPGVSHCAKISVKKGNTNVAFDYGVKVSWSSANAEEPTALQKEFAKQIEITIDNGKEGSAQIKKTFYLSDAAVATNTVNLGYMLLNESADQEFTITATFVSNDNNNIVMGQSIKFDIEVYAYQKTSE